MTTTISEYMTRNPMTIAPNLRLEDARERMYVNNIRHLVVVDGPTVVGVLSTRDLYLLASLVKLDQAEVTVASAMAVKPFTCGPQTPLLDVAREMEAHRYGCAVVIDQGKPVGIFTTTDALRALRAQLLGVKVPPQVRPSHEMAPHEREKIKHHVRLGDLAPATKVGTALGQNLG